ncbi:MAG: tyrosine-protein phosphatase, partial [Pseudomonadota bacterium]
MDSRIKPLEGVRNFRDFGGYESAHGGRVAAGALFRSGHYGEATEQDISALDGFGIAFQVDLRRPDERERFPAKWSGPTLVTNDEGRETEAPHQRFLQRVEASAQEADNWMNDYYAKAPFRPHHQQLFQAWFTGLDSHAAGAALVNCAAGKDRTGIICALTLHVLGVPDEVIYEDYELTNMAAKVDERLPEATEYFNNLLKKDYAEDVYRPFLGVRRRYLETA